MNRIHIGLGRRLSFLVVFSSAFLLLLSIYMAIENVGSTTRTLAGHNLEPTPWHLFDVNHHPMQPSKIFTCSYLSCFRSSNQNHNHYTKNQRACPSFFAWIHKDLAPWKKSRITQFTLMDAQKHASMRIVIVGGRLYVDLYYACVQSRAMFTVWGLLQLLRRYPGMVPDVDMMFDCMDRPVVNRTEYGDKCRPPPPLFRYCTTKEHFDIPFPDWSFWGWSEINIKPWAEEFKSIKLGSQAMPWKMKGSTAYWKGNTDVGSPIRMALVSCNDSKMWNAEIMRQDWGEEASKGFQNSQLSSQCNHRYKIYAEGFAWSVSLKYILSCGSLALIIDPLFEDFFTRGLIPKENYWPISPIDLCQSIKSAVVWGNKHPSEAETIGKRGQAFMEDLDMDRVYDYMYHLIVEYSKLLLYKPVPPSSSQEVCLESILCLADERQRPFLESSYASPSSVFPCNLSPPNE